MLACFGANGFGILDVSETASPTLLGAYQTSEDAARWGRNWGLDVRNGLAYLAAGWGGLEVVDVSDLARPSLLGRIPTWPGDQLASSLRLDPDDDDIVYLGYHRCQGTFMGVFDVSAPTNPVERSSLYLGTGPCSVSHDIVISDARVAHIPLEQTISIADVPRYPEQPSLRGLWSWNGRSMPYGLVLVGDLRFLANPSSEPDVGGLYIQNVADPMDPIELGYFPLEEALGVAVDNGRAYVTGRDVANGYRITVFVLDVSDPAAPVLLTKAVVYGAQSVLADGSAVYVATRYQGIVTLQLSGIWSPGDLNCDGSVDLTDVGPFITALLDPQEYEKQYPDCNINNADTNDDGSVDLSDVEPFIELLIGP